ncbi:hypothetical protein VTK56DRAFT_901 [Thermocarpiscus australiensis]
MPTMDVSALVAEMQETLATMQATLTSLNASSHDTRLNELERKRDGALRALSAAFVAESEVLQRKRQEERQEIAERRRKEDEEREKRRREEDAALAERYRKEDEARDGKLKVDAERIEKETGSLMLQLEEEAQAAIEEGQQKLKALEERRRELNRLISEQLEISLPAVPIRTRRVVRATGLPTAISAESKLSESVGPARAVRDPNGRPDEGRNDRQDDAGPRDGPGAAPHEEQARKFGIGSQVDADTVKENTVMRSINQELGQPKPLESAMPRSEDVDSQGQPGHAGRSAPRTKWHAQVEPEVPGTGKPHIIQGHEPTIAVSAGLVGERKPLEEPEPGVVNHMEVSAVPDPATNVPLGTLPGSVQSTPDIASTRRGPRGGENTAYSFNHGHLTSLTEQDSLGGKASTDEDRVRGAGIHGVDAPGTEEVGEDTEPARGIVDAISGAKEDAEHEGAFSGKAGFEPLDKSFVAYGEAVEHGGHGSLMRPRLTGRGISRHESFYTAEDPSSPEDEGPMATTTFETAWPSHNDSSDGEISPKSVPHKRSRNIGTYRHIQERGNVDDSHLFRLQRSGTVVSDTGGGERATLHHEVDDENDTVVEAHSDENFPGHSGQLSVLKALAESSSVPGVENSERDRGFGEESDQADTPTTTQGRLAHVSLEQDVKPDNTGVQSASDHHHSRWSGLGNSLHDTSQAQPTADIDVRTVFREPRWGDKITSDSHDSVSDHGSRADWHEGRVADDNLLSSNRSSVRGSSLQRKNDEYRDGQHETQGHDSSVAPEKDYFGNSSSLDDAADTESQSFVTPLASIESQSPWPLIEGHFNLLYRVDNGDNAEIRQSTERDPQKYELEDRYATTVHGENDLFDDDGQSGSFDGSQGDAGGGINASQQGPPLWQPDIEQEEQMAERHVDGDDVTRRALNLASKVPGSSDITANRSKSWVEEMYGYFDEEGGQETGPTTPRLQPNTAQDPAAVSIALVASRQGTPPLASRGLASSRRNLDWPRTPAKRESRVSSEDQTPDSLAPRDDTNVAWRTSDGWTPQSLRSQSTLSSPPSSPLNTSTPYMGKPESVNHSPTFKSPPGYSGQPGCTSQAAERNAQGGEPEGRVRSPGSEGSGSGSLFRRMRSIFEQPRSNINMSSRPTNSSAAPPGPADRSSRSRPASGVWFADRTLHADGSPRVKRAYRFSSSAYVEDHVAGEGTRRQH